MSRPWLTRRYRERLRRYLENPVRVAERIGNIAEKILGAVEVYLFGSAAEGDATMASDIDVLVVSPKYSGKDLGKVQDSYSYTGGDRPGRACRDTYRLSGGVRVV